MIVRSGNLMMLIGVIAFIAATGWWFVFFHDVLGDEFQIARECFYWTTDLCSLKSPAGLFSDVPVYEPTLLWVSGGMFVFGLCVRLFGLAGR